jgi:hypothetical protein
VKKDKNKESISNVSTEENPDGTPEEMGEFDLSGSDIIDIDADLGDVESEKAAAKAALSDTVDNIEVDEEDLEVASIGETEVEAPVVKSNKSVPDGADSRRAQLVQFFSGEKEPQREVESEAQYIPNENDFMPIQHTQYDGGKAPVTEESDFFGPETLGYESIKDMSEADRTLLRALNGSYAVQNKQIATLQEELSSLKGNQVGWQVAQLKDQYSRGVRDFKLESLARAMAKENNGRDPVAVISQAVFEFAQNRASRDARFKSFNMYDAVQEVAYFLEKAGAGKSEVTAEQKAAAVLEYLEAKGKRKMRVAGGPGKVKPEVRLDVGDELLGHSGRLDRDKAKTWARRHFPS